MTRSKLNPDAAIMLIAAALALPLLSGCSNDSPAAKESTAIKTQTHPPASAPKYDARFIMEQDAAFEFATAREMGLPENGFVMIADTYSQKAIVVNAKGILREYPMSSSKFGNGFKADSNKTPLGWHKVQERMGDKAAPGTHFISRRPTGQVLAPEEWRNEIDGDYVLTRILWLKGLEPGVNAGDAKIDSHSRHIYIHGTNQEQLLGRPGSHGCIRLSNHDVIELFDMIKGAELYCRII